MGSSNSKKVLAAPRSPKVAKRTQKKVIVRDLKTSKVNWFLEIDELKGRVLEKLGKDVRGFGHRSEVLGYVADIPLALFREFGGTSVILPHRTVLNYLHRLRGHYRISVL